METVGRLVVVRHAEAGWGGSGGDHERPLTALGFEQATRLGRSLVVAGWCPEVVIHSDAMRTAQTWERMAEAVGGSPRVVRSTELYHGGPDAYVQAVERHGGRAGTVLLLGHNPVVGELVQRLCGERVRFATAQAMVLQAEHQGRWESWAVTLAIPLRFGVVGVLVG